MPEYTVNIKVVASSEDAAIQQVTQKLSEAKEKIKETGQAAEESSFGISELKEAVLSLAEAFGVMIGAREVISFFKEMIHAGMDEEHQLIQVADAERRMAGATDEQVEHGKEWLDTLAKISGITKDRLIPSYIQALGVTKDMGTAQAILQVAAGVAAHGYGDLASSVDKMTRFMMTGMIRGSDPLTASIIAGKNAGEDFDTILRTRLIPAFGDAGAKMNDLKMQTERQEVAWEESKKAMGQMSEGIVLLALPALHGLIDLLGFTVGGLTIIGIKAREAFSGFMASLNAAYVFAQTHSLADAVAAYKIKIQEIAVDTELSINEVTERMDKIVNATKTSLGKLTPEQVKAQKAAEDAEEALKKLEEHNKQMKAANDALAKSTLEVARAEESEAKTALQSAEGKKAISVAANLAQTALDKEWAAAKRALAQEKADAIAAAKGDKAAIAVINEAFRNREIALDKDFEAKHLSIAKEAEKKIEAIDKAITDEKKKNEDKQFQDAKAAADKYEAQLKRAADLLLTNEKKNLQQRLQAVKDFYAQERALAEGNAAALAILDQAETAELKRTKEEQVAINRDAQERIVGAMQGMFAQNKEVSLALAIVAAFEGAARAGAAMASAGPWAAAAAYAETLAQLYAAVKGIRGTDIGSSSGGSGAVSSTASPKMAMPAGYGAPPSTTLAPVYHSTTNQTGGNINVNVQTLISADGDRAVQNLAYQVAKQLPVVNRRMSRAPAVQAGKRGH